MKKHKIVDMLGYAVFIGWLGTFLLGTICSRHSLSQDIVGLWLFILLIVCGFRIGLFRKTPKGNRRHYKIAFNRFDTLIHPYTQTLFILFFCVVFLLALFDRVLRNL